MSSTFGEIISSPRDVVDDYECVAYSEPICPPTVQRFTATAPSSPATSPWHTRVVCAKSRLVLLVVFPEPRTALHPMVS